MDSTNRNWIGSTSAATYQASVQLDEETREGILARQKGWELVCVRSVQLDREGVGLVHNWLAFLLFDV